MHRKMKLLIAEPSNESAQECAKLARHAIETRGLEILREPEVVHGKPVWYVRDEHGCFHVDSEGRALYSGRFEDMLMFRKHGRTNHFEALGVTKFNTYIAIQIHPRGLVQLQRMNPASLV